MADVISDGLTARSDLIGHLSTLVFLTVTGDGAGGNIVRHVARRLTSNSETAMPFNRIKLAGVAACNSAFLLWGDTDRVGEET